LPSSKKNPLPVFYTVDLASNENLVKAGGATNKYPLVSVLVLVLAFTKILVKSTVFEI